MLTKVDSGDLLEHLVDIGQDSAMEVAIPVHLEALPKSALRHLKNDVLDSLEFCLDLLVLARCVAQSSKYIHSLIVAALEDEPSRRLWKTGDSDEDEDGEYDLERDWKSPCDGTRLEERKAQV